MFTPRRGSSSGPQPVPRPESPSSSRGRSPAGSIPRATSIARLASPVPSSIQQIPLQGANSGERESFASLTPLAGPADASVPGPGISALAAALSNSLGTSPTRHGTPPIRALSPAASATNINVSGPQSNYGSFDTRSRSMQGPGYAGPSGYEDPEIVRRHLVQPSESQFNDGSNDFDQFGGASTPPRGTKQKSSNEDLGTGLNDDEFSSLRLQGGDVTRPIYRWSEDAQSRAGGKRGQRSQSFHLSRPPPEDEVLNIGSIKVPGGFRRNFLRRAAGSPEPTSRLRDGGEIGPSGINKQPKLLTNNFIEFLTLYGHFAGEELEEDDEDLGPDEYFTSDDLDEYGSDDDESDDDREPMEDSTLLTPSRRKRRRKDRGGSGQNTPFGAALLLLKSFVGTGVLFLPRAYLSGGMLFSNLVLLFIAVLSYYCFVLLVNTRLKVNGSFGDIGGILYGKWMRNIILFSIVVSQIGFVAAYIVFTSENLQAFILAVSNCQTNIEIKYLILMQMAIFLPFSLMRDISKLGFTALIADALILCGLVYLYYYDIFTITMQHGFADIINFNPKDWTLFIGTAIFTFEGIGLIIPIQESMKDQRKFPAVMGWVMVIITVVFISMGALSYAAFGSKTETVVLLNLPQDSKLVNSIQLMYSIAILLSTPLQIFPAIRITENQLFTRSGKYNPYIKWQKNIFRFFVVMMCAAIAWGGADNLDKFVALVGNFACVPLVYIYPPLLHYRGVAKTRFRKMADVVLCIFGAVVMIYTTSLTIMSWAGDSGPALPSYCDGK